MISRSRLKDCFHARQSDQRFLNQQKIAANIYAPASCRVCSPPSVEGAVNSKKKFKGGINSSPASNSAMKTRWTISRRCCGKRIRRSQTKTKTSKGWNRKSDDIPSRHLKQTSA